jgi:hypothetical protein
MLRALLIVALLAITARAEDYQCFNDAGCAGRITEDGVIREEIFRTGDMVSTDGGWSVSTDDGWVKVKTGSRNPAGGPVFGGRLTIGEVWLAAAGPNFPTGTFGIRPPTAFGTYLVPRVSLAELPPSVSLVGLFH